MAYPTTISIVEAAKAFNCATGTITEKLGIKPVTGLEQFRFDRLAKMFHCPREFLASALLQNDKALTRPQAAAMLGIKPHSLNIVSKKRADIVPIVQLGPGAGAGVRYSRKAIENHIALKAALGIMPTSNQPTKNETQALEASP